MLDIEHLQVQYGSIIALRDLSIKVDDGELVALIGANGAGKTTTISTIAGVLRPAKGDIRFEGASIVGRSPEQIIRKGIATILGERLKQPGGTLSGGEQQQLAIARALMSHPKLLMLDEPSLGLAPALVDQIFELISRLHNTGVTMLLVEQNVHRTLDIIDRAYLLQTGRVQVAGTAADIRDRVDIKSIYLGG
jgi:branched-chain amino acid transport system ATP-binding protein